MPDLTIARLPSISRSLLALLMAALLGCVLVGCKKECTICDKYVAAVEKCVKKGAPTAQQLAQEKKVCVEYCQKKKKTKNADVRRRISEKFMSRQVCVVDYGSGGCDAFNKCLAALKAKGK